MELRQVTVIAVLLTLAPADSALRAETTRCFSDVLARLTEPRSVSIDALRQSHIRLGKDGGYEVLLPRPDGSFEIRKAKTFREARHVALTIDVPLDLKGLIKSHAKAVEELYPEFEKISQAGGVELTSRLKTPESLRDKIFTRVEKLGANFNITKIEDYAGVRFVVREKRQIEQIARKVRGIKGTEVVGDEAIAYDRGYRAQHMALKTKSGSVLEIQVMTKRTSDWSAWNHDRVYKAKTGAEPAYMSKLQEYDRAIVTYLNGLDDEVIPRISMPDPKNYGIKLEDVFPADLLR